MELVAAILGGSALDLDVDQIADAIWLSQFLTGRERQAPRLADTAPGGDPGPRPDAEPAGDAQAPRPPEVDAGAGTEPAPSTVDVERAPAAGVVSGARFRSPAASALTQQLELARALRPLAWRSPRPGAWRVVEDVTADRIARTGLWLAELEPETDPALDLVVVVDANPRLHVWQRITRELIDVLRSSSAFRTTTIWRVAGDQPEVVLRAAGGAVRVGGHSVVDAARTTAMLVISDFAGALWSSAAGLACLRLWSRCMMVALVSLVPQRSWGRGLLGTLPATRLTAARRGAPSAALDSEAAVVAGAIPVPVISIDPASFGTWARLVAGRAQARARGVLVLPGVSVEARARYAAAAIRGARGGNPDDLVAELTEAIRASQSADEPGGARERVERFCRTHRPEVVELAAALISAPPELSVMLVVQRAVAPRTGTLELAEIIDSGLFEIEPLRPGDDEVRFRIADEIRDHLSPRASIGDHLRVLEVVGAYLRDHLGSSIDFEAMVVHPTRPTGPVADKDRRFARMFIAELRRLGIDTTALGPPAPEPPAPEPPAPAPQALAPEDQSGVERSGATAAIAPFSDHWVAVAGTGLHELPAPARLAASALGHQLARLGFGLRTRGWLGVDSAVAAAFAHMLRAGGVEAATRLYHVSRIPHTSAGAGALVGTEIAIVLVGGRDVTRSIRDTARSAGIPVILFRGSGGVADDEAVQQRLPSRPMIADEAQAFEEAATVVEQLCALVVGPDRASAFSQLRDRLYDRQPALARRLRLGLDGRATITESTLVRFGPDGRVTSRSIDRPGPAALGEIVRVADGTSIAVLAVAFELLAQLRAWKHVMVLAASSAWRSGEAMSAAAEASHMIADPYSRFALWRHVAPGANNPLATLHAVEAAVAIGDLATARDSLEGLSELLDTDYEEMRERLLRIADNETDSEAAIGLLRRLIDISLWLGDLFQAIRATRRWIARPPTDARAVDLLVTLAARSSPLHGFRALVGSLELVASDHREKLLRAAAEIAQAHPDVVPESDREAVFRQLRDPFQEALVSEHLHNTTGLDEGTPIDSPPIETESPLPRQSNAQEELPIDASFVGENVEHRRQTDASVRAANLILWLDLADANQMEENAVRYQVPEGALILRLTEHGVSPCPQGTPGRWQPVLDGIDRLVRNARKLERQRAGCHFWVTGRAGLPAFFYLGYRLSKMAKVTFLHQLRSGAEKLRLDTSLSTMDATPFFMRIPWPIPRTEATTPAALVVSSVHRPVDHRIYEAMAERRTIAAGIVHAHSPARLDASNIGHAMHDIDEVIQGISEAYVFRPTLAIFIAGPSMLAFLVGHAINPRIWRDVQIFEFDGSRYSLAYELPYPGLPERNTVLLFGLSPVATPRLGVNEGIREIWLEQSSGIAADRLEIEEIPAARPNDIISVLRTREPVAVHFSGHGETGELLFQDHQGDLRPLSTSDFAEIFRLAGSSVRLVVLSACHAESRAEALLGHVECVVVVRGTIWDNDARTFSGALYTHLANGDSVQEAFDKASLEMRLTRAGVSSSRRRDIDSVDPSLSMDYFPALLLEREPGCASWVFLVRGHH